MGREPDQDPKKKQIPILARRSKGVNQDVERARPRTKKVSGQLQSVKNECAVTIAGLRRKGRNQGGVRKRRTEEKGKPQGIHDKKQKRGGSEA